MQFFKSTNKSLLLKHVTWELEEIAPETCFRSDSTIAQYVFDKNYEVLIPDQSNWINNINNDVLNNEIVCFTDGSGLEHTGRAGANVFIESQDIKQVLSLGQYATVFQAEVYAICICVYVTRYRPICTIDRSRCAI